jgi:hypothetical protein
MTERTGRPPALSRAEEWEMYLGRMLGSSIKDCGRVFRVSIPTVNRIIAKFSCDERLTSAICKYRDSMNAFRPQFKEIKRTKLESLGVAARRRWLKSRATPKWANRRVIRALYDECKRVTRETGIRHEVDHIYPILSRTICGLHVEQNLRIVTAAFNLAKSNRWEESYE